MSLVNLVRIGRLEPHETTAEQVARMLVSCRRLLDDAGAVGISDETRFDAAYKAIMQCAMVALWANGFRPLRSAPGHHQTMIQSLVTSIGLDPEEMTLLDVMRVKRNAIDYTGEIVDQGSVDECVAAAARLLSVLESWLEAEHPELLT